MRQRLRSQMLLTLSGIVLIGCAGSYRRERVLEIPGTNYIVLVDRHDGRGYANDRLTLSAQGQLWTSTEFEADESTLQFHWLDSGMLCVTSEHFRVHENPFGSEWTALPGFRILLIRDTSAVPKPRPLVPPHPVACCLEPGCVPAANALDE
ncbi:MAG: hypothetical protein SFX74_06310 [Fimbriimonadaceae bacterium]|nr:hypothetical protein [Fimbriimonadaceae bacterium]